MFGFEGTKLGRPAGPMEENLPRNKSHNANMTKLTNFVAPAIVSR
jgi:hypothetical protein